MIFGFNTDVKHGETVYHVQSEARERELRLQTQVFVSGRCIAKRGTSYAEHHARPDFSANEMHDLLRAQHKEVIELVRTGRVAEVATPEHEVGESSEPAPEEPARAADAPLGLAWLNAESFGSGAPDLQFFVSREGVAVGNADIIVRLNGTAGPPQYGQGSTGSDGRAHVPLSFEAAAHGERVALLVQARSQGQTVTRKYELRRTT